MPSLLLLLTLMGISMATSPSRLDYLWFNKLKRPSWMCRYGPGPLFFLIATISLYASAVIMWQVTRPLDHPWPWMAAYLGLVAVVQGCTLAVCRTRSLIAGTAVSLLGWFWALLLTLAVAAHSGPAAALLLPLVVLSPLNTIASWQMHRINRCRMG